MNNLYNETLALARYFEEALARYGALTGVDTARLMLWSQRHAKALAQMDVRIDETRLLTNPRATIRLLRCAAQRAHDFAAQTTHELEARIIALYLKDKDVFAVRRMRWSQPTIGCIFNPHKRIDIRRLIESDQIAVWMIDSLWDESSFVVFDARSNTFSRLNEFKP